MLTPDQVRKVNLLEALLDEAEEAGCNVQGLPDDAALTWSEEDLRRHFKNLLLQTGSPAANQESNMNSPASNGVRTLFEKPGAETFSAWFPGLQRSGTAFDNPRLRVLCFPSSGNTEDMFTSEGTGARKAVSPLLEWCRQQHAEVLAVQLPGRGARKSEPPCTSLAQLAQQLLPVLGSRLTDGTPYVIISHSMGCWAAFELLRLAHKHGLHMPIAWFLSAMPAPNIPKELRPWRQQHLLLEGEFKEECRAWGINEVVTAPGLWEMYQPLLRADFHLFDSYNYQPFPFTPAYQHNHQSPGGGSNGCLSEQPHILAIVAGDGVRSKACVDGSSSSGGSSSVQCPRSTSSQPRTRLAGVLPSGTALVSTTAAPFDLPIMAFWGRTDGRVKEQLVQAWGPFTTAKFECCCIDGGHLWPLDKEPKQVWLQHIVARLQQVAAI